MPSPAWLVIVSVPPYNANGTVTSTADARGNSTGYGYDPKGNLISITPPAPLGAIAISPDLLSRVHSRTDGKSQTTTYTYDNLDRVTNLAYADSTSIGHGYDNNGNQTSLVDQTGTTTWSYDYQNRQLSKSSPQAGNFTYGYDLVGNLTSLVGAAGTTTYAYNNLNELTTLTDFDSTQTTFSYDPNHSRTSINYPNGVTEATAYDNSQRIGSVIASKAGSTLASYVYSYTNPATNHDAMLTYSEVENDPGYNNTTSDTYDVVNRLTELKISGTISKDYPYQYDGNGNRVQQIEDGGGPTTYAYNAANELTQAGVLTFNWDANGNMLNNSSGLSFTYNAKNQTASMTPPGQSQQAMNYTGSTGRLDYASTTFNSTPLGMYSETNPNGGAMVVNVQTTQSKAQPGTPVKTQAVQQSTPAGTIYYTRTPDGQVITEHIASTNTVIYYIHDKDNSIRALVDVNGTVVARYVYCNTGNDLVTDGATPNHWRQFSRYYLGSGPDSSQVTMGDFADMQINSLPMPSNQLCFAGNLICITPLPWQRQPQTQSDPCQSSGNAASPPFSSEHFVDVRGPRAPWQWFLSCQRAT